jgi:secernin
LALERSGSAAEAIDVIAQLNDSHGPSSSKLAFVLCDPTEVWVMNIAGKDWAAEKVDSAFKTFPRGFSIGTKYDKCSDSVKAKGEFNFSAEFGGASAEISWPGGQPVGDFSVSSMFQILRSLEDGQKPLSSHVSTLSKKGVSCHWFTATPNPCESVFKPFIFTANAKLSPLTKVPAGESTTLLHKLHGNRKWDKVGELLKSMEATCVDEVSCFLSENPGTPNQELDELMKDCVEAEVKFYR